MADLYKVEVLYGSTVVTSGDVYFAGKPKAENFTVRFNEVPQLENVVDAESAVPVVEPPVEALSAPLLKETTEVELIVGKRGRYAKRGEDTDES